MQRQCRDSDQSLNIKSCCVQRGMICINLVELIFDTNRTPYVAVCRCVQFPSQARAASRPLWTEAEWLGWCGELRGGGRGIRKATTPLVVQRVAEVVAVKAWVLKRPAAATKRPAAAPQSHRHRTPFVLKREGSMVTGGVKRSVFKKRTR
jgi:hypothetical protein